MLAPKTLGLCKKEMSHAAHGSPPCLTQLLGWSPCLHQGAAQSKTCTHPTTGAEQVTLGLPVQAALAMPIHAVHSMGRIGVDTGSPHATKSSRGREAWGVGIP